MPLVSQADIPHDDRLIRVITMSRPDARNAMNTAMLMRLVDAVADAVSDDAVSVLVLAGDGGHFSAGADLKEQLDRAGDVRRMELFGQVYESIVTCPKATVAAIEGACVGGGAEVASACDIRVASSELTMRFPGASLGIPVGAAKLVGLVGLGTAKDLVLTSRTIDAAEALRLDIVQRIVTEGPVVEAAIEVARAISDNDARTVSYLKAMFDRFSGQGDRVQAENDALHALAEAGGDYTNLVAPNPKTTSGWSATAWKHR